MRLGRVSKPVNLLPFIHPPCTNRRAYCPRQSSMAGEGAILFSMEMLDIPRVRLSTFHILP